MIKRLVVVPDDHNHKKNNPTFLVYDLNNGSLIYKSPYNEELNCEELVGQGRPTFRPFGVTCDDEYLYIASNKKIAKYNKHTFEFCGLVDIPMYINTHQIMKCDEKFYVTHTGVNVIGIHGKTNTYFDVSSLMCVEQPVTPDDARRCDINHVNSLCEYNNKIYFCLHNLGKSTSQFGYFDRETYQSKIVGSGGMCCHDVQIIDNLYSLSSHTGEIIEIDLRSEVTITHKIVNPDVTFLRGMDTLNGKIIFCGSNFYSDRPIHINNCFISEFDTTMKTANVETHKYTRL